MIVEAEAAKSEVVAVVVVAVGGAMVLITVGAVVLVEVGMVEVGVIGVVEVLRLGVIIAGVIITTGVAAIWCSREWVRMVRNGRWSALYVR